MTAPERTPFVASTLGYLGLVLFVELAALVSIAPDSMRTFTLLAYGATILSRETGLAPGDWGFKDF